ncbi:MAG: AzlC family ABC transporter permease [Paracoccaceae bacterium]
MTHSTTRRAFRKGLQDGAPFAVVIVPFGLLFGVVATNAGLNVIEALSFSIVVIAGAAQFTAVQLLSENAPTWVVLASALAVNLRMAMYSASLTPHLGAAPLWKRAIIAYFLVDQTYACAHMAYEKNPDWGLPEKLSYFFGALAPVCPLWYAATFAGAMVGNTIPPEMALDFAVPITFIAIIAPMLNTGAHRAAALVSVAMALLFAGLPYNMGLLVAAVAGMVTGAEVERRMALAPFGRVPE